MRTVRKSATLLGALLVGLALLLLGAPAASAGGPTSVLLAAPTTSRAAGLYSGDAAYGELERLLEVGRDIQGQKAPSMDALMEGQMVNVTWMIHDVNPWRVDRIYPLPPEDGKGVSTVWIHTTASYAGGPLDLSKGDWHRSPTPKKLATFLDKLGLMGDPGEGEIFVDDAEGAGADETSGTTTGDEPAADSGNSQGTSGSQKDAPATTTAADTALSTGWWWTLPGIAAGAALALTTRPLLRQLPAHIARLRTSRAAAREEGHQGELIDR